jgi:hypothetical protein
MGVFMVLVIVERFLPGLSLGQHSGIGKPFSSRKGREEIRFLTAGG